MLITFIPYIATTLSIIARFIFMILLYRNKSTNPYSLIFSILNVISSSLWLYYSIEIDNTPLTIRSGLDIPLFTISALYIVYNRYKLTISEKKKGGVLPT